MRGSGKPTYAHLWVILVAVPVAIILAIYGVEPAIKMLFLLWLTSPLWLSLYDQLK